VSDKTALGDRMKRYEAATGPSSRAAPTRSSGSTAAPSTPTSAARPPFDEVFMADMDAVAEALCHEITGSVFAYTQSDEISVLVTDFATETTEPWFGGVTAKQLSISASLATAVLNERRPGKRALFDSRVFTLSDPVEVANYFLWRQRDAVRNSISMAAQAHFSHRRLHGVSTGGMQELLWSETRHELERLPATAASAAACPVRRTGERPVEYVDKRTRDDRCTPPRSARGGRPARRSRTSPRSPAAGSPARSRPCRASRRCLRPSRPPWHPEACPS
jgi:tRNA(His) guanylyltransferase